MRGKDCHAISIHGIVGITPAYAGKRSSPCGHPLRFQDHPRVCGEKTATPLVFMALLGSPLRMQGKVCVHRLRHGEPGITPACAGKRRSGSQADRWRWDHPRVCGEKILSQSACLRSIGSPPLMQGKARHTIHKIVGSGITPAYAGKRWTVETYLDANRDHPRVCGEKCASRPHPRQALGSPPRMRGKDELLEVIPNDAGTSISCGWWYGYSKDHPRVCGEKG